MQLNNTTLYVLTTTGIALKFLITAIVVSTNGPPKHSSMVKTQVTLPMSTLLKASIEKAIIYHPFTPSRCVFQRRNLFALSLTKAP